MLKLRVRTQYRPVDAGGSSVPGYRSLAGGVVVELRHLQHSSGLWVKTLEPACRLGRWCCIQQHNLLGFIILETLSMALVAARAGGVAFWRWWFGQLGGRRRCFLSSAGLRVASAPLMCLPESLLRLPLWCGELRALGDVSARLCSTTTQLMPPSC